MEQKTQESQTKEFSLDPTKRYDWTPEDTFTLDGKQFAMIFNTLKSIAEDPKTQEEMKIYQTKALLVNGYRSMLSTLQDGILSGMVKVSDIKATEETKDEMPSAILDSQKN